MLTISIHIKISLIQNMCLKFTFATTMGKKKKICWLRKLNSLIAKVSYQLLPIPCLWNLAKIK